MSVQEDSASQDGASAVPFHGLDARLLSSALSSVSRSLTSASEVLNAFPALWDTPFIPKSQLIFVRSIGAGSFGRVYKGILYDQDVAIKELTVKNMVDSLGESLEPEVDAEGGATDEEGFNASQVARNLLALEKEVSVLRTLRFQKIVMFLGVCLDPPCIVTEYCARGSLFDVISRARERPEVGKRLTWKRRINMALDAAKGMNYLHSHIPPVEHRDLKSPNLLVDEYWNVKVADFNTSK